MKFHLGGDMSKHLAPNGKPSNLTHEQWHLVRTPEFKAWFGDWENDPENASKVVDENGEPMVVYRGWSSNNKFGNVFNYRRNLMGSATIGSSRKSNRFGFYFTMDKKVAKIYADDFAQAYNDDLEHKGSSKEKAIPIVQEYFLKIQNVCDISPSNKNFPSLKSKISDAQKVLKQKSLQDIRETEIFNYTTSIGTKSLSKIVGFKLNDIQLKADDLYERRFHSNYPFVIFSYMINDGYGMDIVLKDALIENEYDGVRFQEFTHYYQSLSKKEKIEFHKKEKKGLIQHYPLVYVVFDSNQIKLADGSNTTFDGSNPDIRYDEGGRVEDFIREGIVELKMYDTTPEHAKEYGLDSVNPLYVQSIYISENQRLKGIGKQVLAYIEKYAIENGHDVVFGHITQKAEPSVDVIKSMLVKSGFNTCEGNNDFYRIIGISDIRFDDGGEVNSNSFMKWYVQWYKGISDKINIVFSLPSVIAPYKEENVVVLDVFEKINQNIDAKPYLKEIVEKADEYGVVIYLEPTPRHNRFQNNLEKKKKITREYLIEYYKRFGFQLTPNNQFMKRLPKSDTDSRFKKGGTMKKINMDFGKYAFTDKNENPKVANTAKRLQQGKYEENTEQEGDILEILSAWTHASTEQNSKKLKELKPIFDVGKTKYPEIFKPKQGVKLLYRGISNLRKDKDVPKDISTYTLVNFDGSSFYLSNQPFDYKPTRDTQSWTTDFKKAKGFSGDAILVTLVSDDFYFNADFMDSLFAKEKETIHIGKKFEHKVFIALSTGLYNELVREKTIKPKKAIDEINKLKFAEGGTMKKVDKGGITYGKSHDEGGIPVKNASTGQMLEVEGGEGIVNKRSMASDKMVKLNGKEMTICQAVSQLNQIEGGVKFSCDDVEHRQFIEAMALGGELERGIRTEKEHIDTLRKLYEKRLTPNQAITEIAKEHIAESPTYYSDLEKNNLNKIAFSESANKLGMSEQSLSELIYDMQGKFFRSRFDTEPIEKPDFEDEDDLTRYAYGGQTKSDCGCSHSPKKYMDGGIFDSGFGSLDSFLGGLEEKNQNKKDAEYSFEVIEYARKLLDKDYKYDLINGLPPKYKVYFENLKEANLYKVGWRFKYGSSRQWAGLCAYNGLVFDKGKTLYLSINFVKHDENWKQNETDTILHEMAHAFVSEFIKTKIPASSFNELDPTDAALEGHGEAFTEVCKALNPNGDCGRFYTKSNLKPSFLPFMYECAFCGVKKYSQNRNFTTICYQCNKPVIVIKND